MSDVVPEMIYVLLNLNTDELFLIVTLFSFKKTILHKKCNHVNVN